MSFSTDKLHSMHAARKFLFPCLKDKFGNDSKILNVENDDTNISRSIDKAGIDLIVDTGDGLFGIASRCLEYRGFTTFTIRKSRHSNPAEYHRINHAMKGGGLYPKYFAQCYYSGDSAAIGLVETKKLFLYIDGFNPKICQNGDVEFYSVDWRDIDFERWRIDKLGTPKKIITS